MVTKKYAGAGLVLAAAVAVFLIFFVDWEARAVKKQLRSVAEQMTWAPAESELTMAARIRKVQEKITASCLVDVPSYRISRYVNEEDVPTYMMIARNYYRTLSVDLHDLEVQSIQLPEAQAVATAYVKATGADGQRNDEVLAIQFHLRKIDKKWLIAEAREMQVLEK